MRWIAVIVSVVTLGCAAKTCPNCGKPYEADAAVVVKQSQEATDELAATISAVDQAAKIEVNNLSNAETTAFKSIDARVGDDGKLILRRNFEQGPMESTGRPLDVAIQGKGYFRVKLANDSGDGFGYTRNGTLNQNNQCEIAIAMDDGYRIDPPIPILPNATSITIAQDGTVSHKLPGSTTDVKVGQIQVFSFVNQDGLRYERGMFHVTDESGPAIQANPGEDGTGQLLQGFLESSNVDKAKSQVRMNYLINWRNDLMEIAKRMSPLILVPNISQK